MLETSKDILLLVIAFCILWLTCFISWGLYYIIMMLREVNSIFGDVRRRLEAIDRFIKTFTDKMERTTNSFELLMEGFNRFSTYFQDKRDGKRRRKTEE